MFPRFFYRAVLCLGILALPACAQSVSQNQQASGADVVDRTPAAERPLLYAGHFVRQSKQPGTRTETFRLPQDSTGPYVLRVTNGSREGGRRARSVRILLNGTEIVASSRLNAKTEFLWVPVTRQLRQQNLLTVTVEGKSGAEIYVTLEDLDAIARAFTPSLALAVSTSGSAAGGHN
jgi:hypothetical protein